MKVRLSTPSSSPVIHFPDEEKISTTSSVKDDPEKRLAKNNIGDKTKKKTRT
jgi:hypothetical protein